MRMLADVIVDMMTLHGPYLETAVSKSIRKYLMYEIVRLESGLSLKMTLFPGRFRSR
jgi:hypothetical protein